tara:strand:+ start:75 stop:1286 length:1212 start_codon:yes stop_codon:yes gene_type:complete
MELENVDSQIAVFGGGRWARVLLGVFIVNTNPNIKFTVHTKHLTEVMRRWINKNGFMDRVFVTEADPDFIRSRYKAAIVVNSVGGHKKSAQMAINAKVPVLVEKPMAPSFEETFALIKSAKDNGVLLSSSQVFLYASYIDNFIDNLGSINDIKCIKLKWTDELAEKRYGEVKSFDSSIPVFKDVLPHLLSILSKILKNNAFEFRSCSVSRGGCCAQIIIFIANVECCLTVERNSNKRRREILVKGKNDFVLDFSTEPGIIIANGQTSCGDSHWSSTPSPLEKMVEEFLKQVSFDKFDNEPNTELALSTSKLIDQIEPYYLKSLDKWLLDTLDKKEAKKSDIYYFLSELVLGTFKVSYNKSEELITHYLGIISSGQLLKEFQNSNTENKDKSIIKFIRSLDINL